MADTKQTRLLDAVAKGDVGGVADALRSGADVNRPTGTNRSTAMHICAETGNQEIARILLEKNANLEAENSSHFTPLMCAVDAGHYDMVRFLYAQGARVDFQNTMGLNALKLASKRKDGADIVTFLLRKNAPLLPRTNAREKTALHYAAVHNNVEIAELLLEKCPLENRETFVNRLDEEDCTALMSASFYGQLNIVDMLSGLAPRTIDSRNSKGYTALMFAAIAGNIEVVKKLLDRGCNANVSTNNNQGRSGKKTGGVGPKVAQAGLMGAFGQVGPRSPSLAAQDLDGGCTALMMAVINGHVDVVQALLDRCDTLTKSAANWTALDYARKNSKQEIVVILERATKSDEASSSDPVAQAWPTKDDLEDPRVKPSKDTPNEQLYKQHKEEGFKHVYPMTKHPRGRAVIINNEKFDHLEDRTGSTKDQKDIAAVFIELGFRVKTHTNLKCKSMEEELEKETLLNHDAFDCFVLVLLSHGYKNHVCGIDALITPGPKPRMEGCLSSKRIGEIFGSCPTLLRKPKLIFIQACRSNELLTMTLATAIAAAAPSGVQEDDDDDDNFRTDAVRASNSMADFFWAFATTAENVAFRHTTAGSLFIQAIVKVFSESACTDDLQTLMTKVNQLVMTRNRGQVAEQTTTLSKKLYFFPGLP